MMLVHSVSTLIREAHGIKGSSLLDKAAAAAVEGEDSDISQDIVVPYSVHVLISG